MFTTALQPDHPIADHVRLHGDGVRDMALVGGRRRRRPGARPPRGARSVREPVHDCATNTGEVRISAIASYGDTIHTFVERRQLPRRVPARLRTWRSRSIARPVGLKYIDHMVGNVGWGEMNRWVEFLSRCDGLQPVPALRRQGHLHGIFGADVEGDVERQRRV